jgi:hypothetical protein
VYSDANHDKGAYSFFFFLVGLFFSIGERWKDGSKSGVSPSWFCDIWGWGRKLQNTNSRGSLVSGGSLK